MKVPEDVPPEASPEPYQKPPLSPKVLDRGHQELAASRVHPSTPGPLGLGLKRFLYLSFLWVYSGFRDLGDRGFGLYGHSRGTWPLAPQMPIGLYFLGAFLFVTQQLDCIFAFVVLGRSVHRPCWDFGSCLLMFAGLWQPSSSSQSHTELEVKGRCVGRGPEPEGCSDR